jgi:DNA-binding transcriptional LysR family regulator
MSRLTPQINLKLLQTFLLVGEHLSFRIAAEKLFRSQSAISAQIVQLEEQLGVTLFHRTTRSVSLTAEGQQLMDYAQRALYEVEAGLRKIRETADIRRGRVAFSCSPSFAATRLASVLSAFEKDYPTIEVHVRELTSAALLASIRQREVDFGIGPVFESSEFKFDTILRESLYALVPRRLALENKKSITLQSLAAMPLLLLDHATALRNMLETTMKARGLTLNMRYEFAQAATLISMARSGLGVAVLPELALPRDKDTRAVWLRIVNPTLIREVAVITTRGQGLSPASLRLVELLHQRTDRGMKGPALSADYSD